MQLQHRRRPEPIDGGGVHRVGDAAVPYGRFDLAMDGTSLRMLQNDPATDRRLARMEGWRRCVRSGSGPKGPLELVDREIPEPGPGTVDKVQACGICHSDSMTKEGLFPGIQYPRVPGHEVAGVIDADRSGSEGLEVGTARRRRLAWRTLRLLRLLPARRFRHLPDRHPGPRHHLRWRLCRVHGRPAGALALDPRRAVADRSRPPDVRRHHDVQLAPQQRRAAGRRRRHSGNRRARPSGRSVRREDGVQDRRASREGGQGAAGQAARRDSYIDSAVAESRRGVEEARRREASSSPRSRAATR